MTHFLFYTFGCSMHFLYQKHYVNIFALSIHISSSPNNGSAVGCNAPPIMFWVLLGFLTLCYHPFEG
uniref:Uncharacterized protein n=1 Tax=Helianthus annuus TaxID=4232 RepID=A0A251ULY6_HELAN